MWPRGTAPIGVGDQIWPELGRSSHGEDAKKKKEERESRERRKRKSVVI